MPGAMEKLAGVRLDMLREVVFFDFNEGMKHPDVNAPNRIIVMSGFASFIEL